MSALASPAETLWAKEREAEHLTREADALAIRRRALREEITALRLSLTNGEAERYRQLAAGKV